MDKSTSNRLNESLANFFVNPDETTTLILKGHLLIEELLNSIIEKFVYHPQILQKSKLSFYQKLFLAKSISINESENEIWKIIENINSLRNDFAHKIESEKREGKIETLKQMYLKQVKGTEFEKDFEINNLNLSLSYVISFCIGFLNGLENEVLANKKNGIIR